MAATPTPFSWTLLEGRTVIREIIEEHIPEWRTRPAQLDCWSHTLAGIPTIPTILIASTGWGKTTEDYKYYLLCWRRLDMNETLLGADTSKLDCRRNEAT